MDNQEKIRAVEKWQENKRIHPLTCGNNSQKHRKLAVQERGGKVILYCKDCKYTQDWIPEIIFTEYERLKARG